MKVKVNQEACIGCGACCAYAEEVFEINEDGLSEVVKEEISAEEEQNVKDEKLNGTSKETSRIIFI